jgi:hypothetical protein
LERVDLVLMVGFCAFLVPVDFKFLIFFFMVSVPGLKFLA